MHFVHLLHHICGIYSFCYIQYLLNLLCIYIYNIYTHHHIYYIHYILYTQYIIQIHSYNELHPPKNKQQYDIKTSLVTSCLTKRQNLRGLLQRLVILQDLLRASGNVVMTCATNRRIIAITHIYIYRHTCMYVCMYVCIYIYMHMGQTWGYQCKGCI